MVYYLVKGYFKLDKDGRIIRNGKPVETFNFDIGIKYSYKDALSTRKESGNDSIVIKSTYEISKIAANNFKQSISRKHKMDFSRTLRGRMSARLRTCIDVPLGVAVDRDPLFSEPVIDMTKIEKNVNALKKESFHYIDEVSPIINSGISEDKFDINKSTLISEEEISYEDYLYSKPIFYFNGVCTDTYVYDAVTSIYIINNWINKHDIYIELISQDNESFSFVVFGNYENINKITIKKILKKFFSIHKLEYTSLDIGEITLEYLIDITEYGDSFFYDNRKEMRIYNQIARFATKKIDFKNHLLGLKQTYIKDLNYAESADNNEDAIKERIEKLGNKSLSEEIKRITQSNDCELPSIYLLNLKSETMRNDAKDLLIHYLKKHNRIKREIIHEIDYIEKNIRHIYWWGGGYFGNYFSHYCSPFPYLYSDIEYGAVVININDEEAINKSNDEKKEKIRVDAQRDLCNIAYENRKNVTTIFCINDIDSSMTKQLAERLEDVNIVIIQDELDNIEYIKKLLLDTYSNKKDCNEAYLNSFDNIEEEAIEKQYEDYDKFCDNYFASINCPENNDLSSIRQEPVVSAINELHSLIGLDNIKDEISKLLSFYDVQRIKENRGMQKINTSKHMVFYGNPGTAKTTVARIFAEIMKAHNHLETGVFVEVGRGDLIGEYTGQTPGKVRRKFEEAKGGILFIDEAYSLYYESGSRGGYSDEAISTIVQEMENRRDNIIVIFAGYKKEMDKFIDSNPGLRSRISRYLDFEDYSEDELIEILKSMAEKSSMKLDIDDYEPIRQHLRGLIGTPNFGNGRHMRNLFETAIVNQASRVTKGKLLSNEDLITIKLEDVYLPIKQNEKKLQIGFTDITI